jgi:hypothetical protein
MQGSGLISISRTLHLDSSYEYADSSVSAQAIRAKRYADAYGAMPAARQEFLDKVSPNPILSALRFTDSLLLFLYAYWCHEHASGRPRPNDFQTSAAMRSSIRTTWEHEWRRTDISIEQRERTGCMVGLMYVQLHSSPRYRC